MSNSLQSTEATNIVEGNSEYKNLSETIIYTTKSGESELYVVERESFRGEKGKYRFLRFDKGGYLGGINLINPNNNIFSYIRNMLDIAENMRKEAKEFYMIGHGVGSITKTLNSQGKRITVAELDENILKLSKQYFDYQGENVIIGDGRGILERKRDNSLDVIFIDAFLREIIPNHLTSKEFFALAKRKNTDNGIVVMNVMGKINSDSLAQSIFGTISNIYPEVKVFAKHQEVDRVQNLIFVSSQSPLPNVSLNEVKEVRVQCGEIIIDDVKR
ncbi:spermidine synthase [Bacillus mycoides]|uniref:PABS domain-containing protein n=1 Tax=Bacillus mycoides TaxID=1405 RepID=A0ABC9QUW2_BACMY|nr:fused MFS/spermidine synthase [Bacillus mycoides]EJR29916.1 hypothetical protein III_05685 [Bacillus mycoides]